MKLLNGTSRMRRQMPSSWPRTGGLLLNDSITLNFGTMEIMPSNRRRTLILSPPVTFFVIASDKPRVFLRLRRQRQMRGDQRHQLGRGIAAAAPVVVQEDLDRHRRRIGAEQRLHDDHHHRLAVRAGAVEHQEDLLGIVGGQAIAEPALQEGAHVGSGCAHSRNRSHSGQPGTRAPL
jgi:hypothetical protein